LTTSPSATSPSAPSKPGTAPSEAAASGGAPFGVPVSGPPARRRLDVQRWAVPSGSVLVAVLAVFIWWVGSLAYFVVPSPGATMQALISSFGDERYLINMQSTAIAAVLALVVSVVAGLLIGMALGLVPWLSRGFEPLLVASNGVPKIVLYPVLLLMLGMGTTSKVALGAVIGVFPVMMNVAAGIRDMPLIYARLGRSLEASRWQMFRHIIVPAIRRPAMVGIRLAVSLSTVGVVLAEMFATRYGLGRVILASHSAGQYDRMLATVVLLVVVAFVATMLLWRLERRMR
jgi:NitT/TauT family transport system permease protein